MSINNNIRNNVYDFMEYMVNDNTGNIGVTYIDYESVVNQLLRRNPRAIMYYNMYSTYFENHKKYLKKENLPYYRFTNFDNIDSLIESATNYCARNNENIIFTFCKFLWLYMHH